MRKLFSAVLLSGLLALLVTFVSAQEKKPAEPPKPVQSPSQELLGVWNYIGGKVAAMAEGFPEDKYSFKAQKDERTFGENLVHIASTEYMFMNLMMAFFHSASIVMRRSRLLVGKLLSRVHDVVRVEDLLDRPHRPQRYRGVFEIEVVLVLYADAVARGN